jgi:hypothetical protein
VISYVQKRYVLAGVFGALSFLLKPPGLVEMGALGFHILMTNSHRFKALKQLAGGFMLPIAMVSIYFLLAGGFSSFITEAFINNVLYTGSWQLITDPTVWMGIKLTGLVVFTVYVWQNKKSYTTNELLLYLWLVFSLFGVTLSNRPYLHYLIQLVVPLTLFISGIAHKKYWTLAALTIGIMYIFFGYVQFHLDLNTIRYPLAYYQNFKDPTFFDSKNVPVTYELADYLQKYTDPQEKVFIWSDNSLIYALSKRSPATPFITAYHISGNTARENQVIAELQRNNTRVIIVTKPVVHEFPALIELIELRYNKKVSNEQYDIYVLL